MLCSQLSVASFPNSTNVPADKKSAGLEQTVRFQSHVGILQSCAGLETQQKNLVSFLCFTDEETDTSIGQGCGLRQGCPKIQAS